MVDPALHAGLLLPLALLHVVGHTVERQAEKVDRNAHADDGNARDPRGTPENGIDQFDEVYQRLDRNIPEYLRHEVLPWIRDL